MSSPLSHPMLRPEIGPDGLAREAPVIAYTEKVIEEEQLQLRKYIEENYSKIRDVERELANLSMEMKLTAGPKKAALELMRKKIELSTERIRLAKQKEEQARKVWEGASAAVKEEEATKEKLCEDLNQLVQESSNSQFARLEELKRRLEALNPNRASTTLNRDGQLAGVERNPSPGDQSLRPVSELEGSGTTGNFSSEAKRQDDLVTDGQGDVNHEIEAKLKRKFQFHGKGRGKGSLIKGRGPSLPGWTGAGFDVDGRS